MAATAPRMPVEFSDDLDRALYRESRDGVPVEKRVSCPVHLNWRARCRHLHDAR